eukprot:6138968-Prymnesium_polylepis.1
MWTPICRWTPAQARQSIAPKLMEAHAGGGWHAPQSAHAVLPWVCLTRPKTVPARDETERRATREQPSSAAVAFWMTVVQ